MPREELFLNDIIEAANAAEKFLAGVSEKDFLASELLQSAVLYKLTVIGEAAVRISDDLKSRHPEIAWKKIHRVSQHRRPRIFFDKLGYGLDGSYRGRENSSAANYRNTAN